MMFPTSAEYRTKNSGPRTEPCGTPYKTDRGVVKIFDWQTDCVRSVKYEENQRCTEEDTPYEVNMR